MTKFIALLSLATVSFTNAWNPWRYHHESHRHGYFESTGWNGWGGDLSNSRRAHASILNTHNAGSLAVHCKIQYTNGVSATPTIEGDIAYYPTWGGELVALNYKTCQTVWATNITQVVMVSSLIWSMSWDTKLCSLRALS